ncbi:hypothetical protein E3P99_01658 [Wallemia hederae]|uniref:mRNA export factor GLE1 n=1 Tax=Wallemia hederae TaxID=1540922 RepID=A0A4T0FQW8_9BASI|nr:hypothetical protein E3P99_01658 [Wallemia hederae]
MKFKVPEISKNGYGISDSDSDDDYPTPPRRLKSILKSSAAAKSPPTRASLNKSHIDSDYGRWDEIEHFQNTYTSSVDYHHLNDSFTRSSSLQHLETDTSIDKELEAIQSTISSLQLQSQEETRKLAHDFDKRNKDLWSSIEASISLAQKDADRELEEQKRAEETRQRIAQEQDEQRKEEMRKKEAEQKQQMQERSKQIQQEKAEAEKQKFGLVSAKKEYEHWYSLIMEVKRNVLPLVAQDPAIKKACSASKRKITPKIGQLTNSIGQIKRIVGVALRFRLEAHLISTQTSEISDILSEPKNLHGDQSPAYIWLLNHLSKCLLRQAEAEVSAKITTAFPLARLVVSLVVSEHPRLADILMGRLVKKACWIVPYYPLRGEGESEEQWMRRIGRKNKDETTVQYNDRMGGTAAFYFAILQTRLTSTNLVLPQQVGDDDIISRLPAQFRFSQSWTWLSHALRPPMPTLSTIPQLLATFFEMLGEPYRLAYGKQAVKVLQLIKSRIDDENAWAKNSEANMTRIKLLLDKWQTGQPLSSSDGRIWEA